MASSFNYSGQTVHYNVAPKVVTIYDGYKINDATKMQHIIMHLKMLYPTNQILVNRTTRDLVSEWKACNRFYFAGIFKSRMQNINFLYPQSRFTKIYYALLGF